MIVLDTNVLSELMRRAPEQRVEQWLAEQPSASLFISAVTEAELRAGVALMPHGKRRLNVESAVEEMLGEDFAGRILPFDSPAARAALLSPPATWRILKSPELGWSIPGLRAEAINVRARRQEHQHGSLCVSRSASRSFDRQGSGA